MEETLKQKAYDCIRIVLFGPESTGKTTLTKLLATHYKTTWVPEYMREYLQKKWDKTKEICTKEDLIPIAEGQIKLENEAAVSAGSILFCDTNVLELQVYSQYYFDGYSPAELISAVKECHYDFYFLTDIDVPWEADDLRDRPEDRSTLFCIFESELKKEKLPYQILNGTLQDRFGMAIIKIEELLNKE